MQCVMRWKAQHFYPRSPCGERPFDCGDFQRGNAISIHALLAESDSIRPTIAHALQHFYPRSPCGERRFDLPVRFSKARDFYPRSPCGERLVDADGLVTVPPISIHALLAESDHSIVAISSV